MGSSTLSAAQSAKENRTWTDLGSSWIQMTHNPIMMRSTTTSMNASSARTTRTKRCFPTFGNRMIYQLTTQCYTKIRLIPSRKSCVSAFQTTLTFLFADRLHQSIWRRVLSPRQSSSRSWETASRRSLGATCAWVTLFQSFPTTRPSASITKPANWSLITIWQLRTPHAKHRAKFCARTGISSRRRNSLCVHTVQKSYQTV